MNQELTAVEVIFRAGGEITLRRFEWHGTWLDVEAEGRQWSDDHLRCFNVVALDGHLFEIRFDPASLRWTLARGPVPGLAV